MCGILALLGATDIETARRLSQVLTHRGPDEHGYQTVDSYPGGAVLCHERLSIVDLHTGHQPIQGSRDNWVIHNGEIYNHADLRQTMLTQGQTQRTHSDSEIIVHLWEEMGVDCIQHLDGIFGFVVIDGTTFFAGRDAVGVKPLFYGKRESDGSLWFASEQKSLIEVCDTIDELLPGHYYHSEHGIVKWYNPVYHSPSHIPKEDGSRICELLTSAVVKRLMSDAPLGCLCSGGVDSSLVTSIVCRELKRRGEPMPKTFAIGMDPNQHDLVNARAVAEFLGTEHHEILFNFDEAVSIIREVIWHAETYDLAEVRTTMVQTLLSRYIKAQDVKVVLVGEGADEIFGGYLYFGRAPDPRAFHNECVRRTDLLYTCELLRVDRSTMSIGVEARVPFLDKEFLAYVLSIDPTLKLPVPGEKIEKYIMRKAFDTPDEPYLPDCVLWRQKEQFSDGVGYGWIDGLKKNGEAHVTDEEMSGAAERWPHNTPMTKEHYFYRQIYEEFFHHPSCAKLVHPWLPLWQDNLDPSGRSNDLHKTNTGDADAFDRAVEASV